MRYRDFYPYYLFPAPCSLFPVPCSLKPIKMYLMSLIIAIHVADFVGVEAN
ncbi:MAG: hypothetical protein F6K26_15255 [Moorea sp. SIO2I5]|nr:hypothetical protein [Moorena sp. SIO2I5]